MPRRIEDIEGLRLLLKIALVTPKGRHIRTLFREKNLKLMRSVYLPTKSSFFIESMFNDLLEIRHPRMFLITAHLYLERVLNEIILHEIQFPKDILKFGLYRKAILLHSIGKLDDEVLRIILQINRIRNRFAHDLNYEVKTEKLQKFPGGAVMLKEFPLKYKKQRLWRDQLFLAWVMMDLVFTLSENFSYLLDMRS